jgi:hypothetical protein
MDRTATSTSHQQNRLKAYQENCDSYHYSNMRTSDALLDTVEEPLPEHRERLYPPTETLSIFLAQTVNADRSSQNIVNQSAVQKIVT